MDLTFHTEEGSFNCRVAAIVIRDDRLLVMRNDPQSHYYLPGGRVALGETAEQAVARELEEELGVTAAVVRPLWLHQNFFTPDGTCRRYHELCFYFLMDVSGTTLAAAPDVFFHREGDREREFSWMPFEKLKSLYFHPIFLKTEIFYLPKVLTFRTDAEPLYRAVLAEELTDDLFAGFRRRQEVTDCWRKENGQWVIRPLPRLIEDWGEKEHAFICWCLKNTLAQGGVVYGAFVQGKLKGIIAVEALPMGSRGQYREIPFLQVSRDFRGQGIGRQLFSLAKVWAKEQGAQMLYISSQPSVETQAFYKTMGCVEAEEYSPEHVQRSPDDCQIQCSLSI